MTTARLGLYTQTCTEVLFPWPEPMASSGSQAGFGKTLLSRSSGTRAQRLMLGAQVLPVAPAPAPAPAAGRSVGRGMGQTAKPFLVTQTLLLG